MNQISVHFFTKKISGSRTAIRKAGTHSFRNYDSDAYQFLQRSLIPTYHFQKSLRRLPIPKLQKSCERYLLALQAVYGEGPEVKEAEQLVQQFLKGEGPELQKALEEYDRENSLSSYISEPWFDMYLSSRVPCPINCNPFMMFAPDPEPAYNNQLLRATNFVISCGRFKRALDAEILEPEVFHLNPAKSNTPFFHKFCSFLPPSISWFGAVAFKAFPLDMSQYKSLFGGCRIPETGKDRLILCTESRHFLVVKNGNFYAVDLFDEKGKLYSPVHIYASLREILVKHEPPLNDENCVGSLTTLDRNAWADARSELISLDKRNLESISSIENGLFLLCLDDLSTDDPNRLVQSLLCGDDGRNRWFDKCFQLIVDGNGQATINFEHSWGDGVAVLRLMEETLKDTIAHRFVVDGEQLSQDSPAGKSVKKLGWQLNDSLRSKIANARMQHLKNSQKLDFGVLEHKALNKSAIKTAKLSPDAVMQLGIQLAYHKIYNEFVPTYESCSTAAFLKGRTECIRSATMATREAVLAFEKENTNSSRLFELLRNCSDVHSKLVKEASLGQGFDRHLFGIRHTAERLGKQPNPFFTNKIYQRMGHFVLSTSTLSTDTIYFGGFGPVVPDGLGIAYNVTDQKLGAAVSSYKDKKNASEFCRALDVGLNQIRLTIEEANK